jgi:hypothetical protein
MWRGSHCIGYLTNFRAFRSCRIRLQRRQIFELLIGAAVILGCMVEMGTLLLAVIARFKTQPKH